MKKKRDDCFSHCINFYFQRLNLRVWIIMCCLLPLTAFSGIESQVSIRKQNASLEEIIWELKQNTKLTFLYSDEDIQNIKGINLNETATSVDAILTKCLNGTNLEYLTDRNSIIIRKANSTPQNNKTLNTEIKGKVKDKQGNPLPGATILLKETTLGTVTDANGNFTLKVPDTQCVLVCSFIGMKSQEIIPGNKKTLEIVLEEDAAEIEEVVVTGIFTRKKESFTGSASTYTVKELKTMGTQNILQSLKTLDPSFNILENAEFGSDPNKLPNMEIRGKSSMLGVRDGLDVDPNQPLFILDGFESSLAVINDLDINRVESITILKDAASTAIYGSKAANGVVVVETKKPQPGQLMVNYNGNANITMPDLSSYNLMNATEKLEYEKLAGRYNPSSWSATNEIELNKLYHEKLKAIESGVDTYWLAEPLRVGVNQKHSLYVEGGEGGFLFGIGAGYNGNTGVMKKSSREIISGNIDLVYRISKFQLSNKFSMNNTKIENPIVAFNEYAAANPYYKKQDDEGMVTKWLENNENFKSPNPLWNARQNSRDEGKELSLSNYLIAEYRPNDDIRLRARFGLTYSNNDGEKFYSRNDTRFEEVENIKKGTYSANNTKHNKYEGEFTATYAKVIKKHQINAVVGGNLYVDNSLTQGYSAEGFPEGDFVYPSFANGYPENGSPLYHEYETRSLNAYLNLGYSFDNRYLLDISLRENGSSVFGSSRRWMETWSVGLGWNIHNEAFIADHMTWVDFLKLRASMGNPGNQNFSSSSTITTFSIGLGSMNYFGVGAALNQLGNPDLDWQITLDKNIGLDLTLLNKRLNIVVDYYHKVTDPLLININMPQSSGMTTYLTNMGKQISQGLTLSLSYYLIQNLDERFSWMIRGNLRTQNTKLDDIGNKLNEFNNSGKGRNTVRYYDGADPDDIWAVRSAGIDPATGRELFYDKNGNYTYDFSYDNEIIIGNTRPKYEGVFGTSINYKGFSLSMNFRYQLGAYIMNSALYNKVENLSLESLNYNQDKRALYERWKKPGDIVRFKDIANSASSPMSSRFVQKENVLAMESLYFAYEFYEGWIKQIGLSNLKIQASMRDVFRCSTIKTERGTSYPFARTMELGLSFNF